MCTKILPLTTQIIQQVHMAPQLWKNTVGNTKKQYMLFSVQTFRSVFMQNWWPSLTLFPCSITNKQDCLTGERQCHMDIIYKLISTVYCGQVVTDVTPAFRENMRKRKEQQRSAPSLGRFVVTHRSRWLAYKTTFFMDQSIFL